MCKLAHVIRYTVLSQHFHFCWFRAMAYDCETECSFDYLICDNFETVRDRM